jgi:hypothetical protein
MLSHCKLRDEVLSVGATKDETCHVLSALTNSDLIGSLLDDRGFVIDRFCAPIGNCENYDIRMSPTMPEQIINVI